jgi:transcription elongation factor GreA
MPTTQLTQETYDRLSSELEDLTTRGRIEIAKQIEAARALGDLSENGDYHAAKDAQGKMEARIRQLQAMLEDAEVVEKSDDKPTTVEIGTVVSIRYEDDGEEESYFVGSIEEKRDGLTVLSPNSPLGKVLLGRSVNEHVSYMAPNGEIKVIILNIE